VEQLKPAYSILHFVGFFAILVALGSLAAETADSFEAFGRGERIATIMNVVLWSYLGRQFIVPKQIAATILLCLAILCSSSLTKGISWDIVTLYATFLFAIVFGVERWIRPLLQK
jgi:hypothetical protein